MIELVGSLFILMGAVFLFSAGLGLVRMPDVYTRIQSGTKATTLGNMLILIGLAFYHPDWTFKLILVIYFVLMTNPVSSHALSRAAYLIGTPMTSTSTSDALAEVEGSIENGTGSDHDPNNGSDPRSAS
jgi:multicomponent Na+:H+ antiporter subunit G